MQTYRASRHLCLITMVNVQIIATEPNAPVIEQPARLDAEMEVARDANPVQWGVGGGLCGFFALGVSVAHTPTVPTANLMGKSPEYVVFYTNAYRSTMKRKNIAAAGIECLVNGSISVVLFLLIF